jgi:hypothetical protein
LHRPFDAAICVAAIVAAEDVLLQGIAAMRASEVDMTIRWGLVQNSIYWLPSAMSAQLSAVSFQFSQATARRAGFKVKKCATSSHFRGAGNFAGDF